MGDIGLDKWYQMMEDHQNRGHHIIRYPEMKKHHIAKHSEIDKKVNKVKKIKQGLILKEQRVTYWQKHYNIPTTSNLIWQEHEK